MFPARKKSATVVEPAPDAAKLGDAHRPSGTTVKVWAAVGGALLVLQLYVWIRWVTGPYFVRVPAGPSDPPTYMKIFLTANGALMCVGLPAAIWWFLIRPWVRERRITLDGLLLISCALFFFQDPLLNYLNTWCTYNTWLWNRGSWSSHIPRVGVTRIARPPSRRTLADQRNRLRDGVAACHRRVLVHAPTEVALAAHEQPAAHPDYLCGRHRPRLRHGSLLHASVRALHVSRCHPIGFGLRGHLSSVAHL